MQSREGLEKTLLRGRFFYYKYQFSNHLCLIRTRFLLTYAGDACPLDVSNVPFLVALEENPSLTWGRIPNHSAFNTSCTRWGWRWRVKMNWNRIKISVKSSVKSMEHLPKLFTCQDASRNFQNRHPVRNVPHPAVKNKITPYKTAMSGANAQVRGRVELFSGSKTKKR